MSYRLLRFICVTMILLQFFAIHVSQSRSALAQSGGVAQVSLTNNGFDPATLTIVLGTQVRWTNQTGASYTLSTGNLEDRSMVYLPIIQAWSRAARATAATTLFPQDNGDKFSVTLLPAQSYGHTFTQVGKYPYQAGSFKGTIIVTEPTQLVLFHIGDSTLPLGNTLSIQLRAYDPGGASITFAVGPLPLPANMTLDSNTGAFVFRPNASQAGPVTLTFQALTGAGAVATEQVTIQVTGPGGIEQTGVRGRILDANAIARGEIKPLVGATVTHLGSGRSVTTDSNGYFALIGLSPGVNHFDYNGATATPINTYGGYRAKLTLLAGVTHEIERPLYIMQIDKAAETQVDPTDTTVVRNPSLNIDLTIPAHTVMDDNDTEYAGNISVSQVPVGFTPAALPATMAPALVVTIQPMGLTFDQPAPITFENIMGLKPGENVNIWSMDHASGQFFVAGIGQVSADGARIETIQGGIRESSWHFPLPPPPPVADTPDQDSDNSNHPDKCECTTSSTTSMREGTLTTDFSLPAYRTLGAARSLTFVYASAHAYPYKTIPLDVSTDPDSYPGTGSEDLIMPIADLFSYNLTVGGVTQGKETFFTAPTSSVVRIAPSFTAAAFQTGVYPYVVNIQGAFLGASPLLPSARVSAARVGHTIVVNEQNSPLGAGWGIAGLQRLYVQPDKTGLIVDGSGATQRFAIGLAGTPRQPLPAAKGALVAATMADGIHVVGGADSWSGAGVTTTHVVFDPTTNDWGTRAPVPDNNMWGAVGAVVAGKLYLFGGWSSGDILTRVYDPATDTWAPRADIPAPGFNYGHTAAVVNNQVYVVGGTNGNHLFRYDPATNSWATDLAAIPTNQATLAADVIAGEIYVVGVGAQLQIYNPAANTWRQGAPLPIATLRPSVAAVNNKLYLFGGSTDDLGGDIRAIQVYDPATDTWEQRLELSGARSWSAAAVYNNDVYVVGGFNQENSATALNEFVTLTATSAPRWYGPDGDYSTLQLLADGTAVRYFADGTQSRFNVNGLQTAAVDRNGKATTYFYDAQDRLLTITDPVGQVTTLTYGGNRLQAVVDPVGRTTSFTHDAAGNLIKVTFPDGSTRAFGYDPRHLMTSESDPLGKTTTRTFDWAGRMDSATLPDASLRKVTSVQGAGAVDPALGLGTVNEPIIAVPAPTVNTLVNGEGLTTTITTGRFGEATLIIGPDGLSTTMERDNQGNATIVRLPSGAEFQMT